MLSTCVQISAGLNFFFCFHHAEELKLSSGPLSLAALRHSKCQSRSTQKAQTSFTACFKTMPRWVNWRRVVLSSDPGSDTMPSGSQVWQVCWHSAVLMPLECFLHTSTVCSISILKWRKAVTCPMGCFFQLFSSALVPWSVLHLYHGVLSCKWVWTYGNRKSGPKGTNK